MKHFRSPETETFWRYIAGSLDRLFALVESLPADHLAWRPPAPETNSILALARHTMGNAADNILGTLAGRERERRREAEFTPGQAGDLLEAWAALRPELESALCEVTAERMSSLIEHPRRGAVQGREILIVVARHAAEHLGQAELTRDLAATQAT